MTLHQLRTFQAVAKLLNISRAANELHISQPSVSQQLKLLEEEYEIKLYKKVGRVIELTQAGRLFLKKADAILVKVGELEKDFTSKYRKTDSLAIGSSHGPAMSFLPSVLGDFKKTYPEIQISLRTESNYTIERLVLNSEIDIGMISSPPHSSSLIYEPCRQMKLVGVVSRKHSLANRKELSLADLAKVPLIVRRGMKSRNGWPSDSTISKISKGLAQQGLKPKVAMYTESPEATLALVNAGGGLGIMYRSATRTDNRRGELKFIEIPRLNMQITSFIIYRKQGSLSPIAKDLLTFLHQESRKTRQAKAPLRVA